MTSLGRDWNGFTLSRVFDLQPLIVHRSKLVSIRQDGQRVGGLEAVAVEDKRRPGTRGTCARSAAAAVQFVTVDDRHGGKSKIC